MYTDPPLLVVFTSHSLLGAVFRGIHPAIGISTMKNGPRATPSVFQIGFDGARLETVGHRNGNGHA